MVKIKLIDGSIYEPDEETQDIIINRINNSSSNRLLYFRVKGKDIFIPYTSILKIVEQ
jgi:hypothetical protein